MRPATPANGVGHTNTVRIGYARISTRAQDHQSQLDALDGPPLGSVRPAPK
jgi:hypothetical protein